MTDAQNLAVHPVIAAAIEARAQALLRELEGHVLTYSERFRDQVQVATQAPIDALAQRVAALEAQMVDAIARLDAALLAQRRMTDAARLEASTAAVSRALTRPATLEAMADALRPFLDAKQESRR